MTVHDGRRLAPFRARALAAGLVLLATAACGDTPAPTNALPASSPSSPALTRVVVTPATASIPVGDSVAFHATGYTAAGTALATIACGWSADNPAVTGISGGMARGLAAGSTLVKAGCGGIVGTASLTVSAQAPPPPPAPASALLFTDGFESGFAPLQNGAGWENTAVPNVAVSTDVAHAGSHSLKFTFPGKAECLDASAELRFSLGQPMQEVWLEWYIYYPAGGEGGSARYDHRWEYPVCTPPNQSDNNKFLALFGPVYQAEPTLLVQTWTTTLAQSVPPIAPGDSRIQTAATQAGLGGAAPGYADDMTFISGDADRGRWIQIRLHARVADFGKNDGVVQLWKDGVLVLNDNSLPWYDSSNQANYLTQGYLLGWSNSGYAQTTNIYVDDFRIIGQNPGW